MIKENNENQNVDGGKPLGRLVFIREHISAIWKIELDFPAGLFSKSSLLFLLLLVAVCCSSLAIVYSAHESRGLFHSLTVMKEKRESLQTEWGQLLLEQSALSSHTRVERYASNKLHMNFPDSKSIKLVIDAGR